MTMVQARKGFQLEWNSEGEGRTQSKLLKDLVGNPRQTAGNRDTMGQQLSLQVQGPGRWEKVESKHNGPQACEGQCCGSD